MKAFSIKQPNLDAILYGGKAPENRSWSLPAKYVGIPVLLHASAEPDRRAVLPAGINMSGWPGVRGAILAQATFTGCHLEAGCCHLWGQRHVFHWQPADIHVLPEPVPAKGSLQFWTPTPDVLAAVSEQLGAVAK